MEKDRSPIRCVTPQMATATRAEPGIREQPGTSSESSRWVRGTQVLGLSAAASQAH